MVQTGRQIAATPAPTRQATTRATTHCAVILSPHPDDECLLGALPLRLQNENTWRVVNLAITHGSKPERQLERAQEMHQACRVLGFEGRELAPRGLQRVNLATRQQEPSHWQQSVERVHAQLLELKPDLIVCPHPKDAQAAHRGTWQLAMDALGLMPASFKSLSCSKVAVVFIMVKG